MKQQYYEWFYKFCSNKASNEAAIQLNSLSDQQICVSLTLFFGGAIYIYILTYYIYIYIIIIYIM